MVNREKSLRRLARLKPNSGHARVLRKKLGITDEAAASPAPVQEASSPPTQKKASKKKKRQS